MISQWVKTVNGKMERKGECHFFKKKAANQDGVLALRCRGPPSGPAGAGAGAGAVTGLRRAAWASLQIMLIHIIFGFRLGLFLFLLSPF